MLRQATLAWWQCASRILCHHANAARRSPQLSSTLARAFHHRGLPTVVLAHIRIRKSALAWSLRAKPAHSHLAVTASRKPTSHATLRRRQSGQPLEVAISRHLLRNALDLSHSRAVRTHLRRAPSQRRACQHRLPHSACFRAVPHAHSVFSRRGLKPSRLAHSLLGRAGVQTVHGQCLVLRSSIAHGRCQESPSRRVAA